MPISDSPVGELLASDFYLCFGTNGRHERARQLDVLGSSPCNLFENRSGEFSESQVHSMSLETVRPELGNRSPLLIQV